MNWVAFGLYYTEQEAKKALRSMLRRGEVQEIELPHVAKRKETMFREDIKRPWGIWVNVIA